MTTSLFYLGLKDSSDCWDFFSRKFRLKSDWIYLLVTFIVYYGRNLYLFKNRHLQSPNHLSILSIYPPIIFFQIHSNPPPDGLSRGPTHLPHQRNLDSRILFCLNSPKLWSFSKKLLFPFAWPFIKEFYLIFLL